MNANAIVKWQQLTLALQFFHSVLAKNYRKVQIAIVSLELVENCVACKDFVCYIDFWY
jgi:hypothetical protein